MTVYPGLSLHLRQQESLIGEYERRKGVFSLKLQCIIVCKKILGNGPVYMGRELAPEREIKPSAVPEF